MPANEETLSQLAVTAQHLNSLEKAITSQKQLMVILIILTGITLLLNKC